MNPANLLREARRTAGLSQEELAARAGCAQSTLARVEAGLRAPSIEDDVQVLGRAVAALGVHRPGEQLPSDTSWVVRPPEPLTLAELRDPFVRLEMGRKNIPIRLRLTSEDPRAGAIKISIEDGYETAEVPVVPLHALTLPPRIGDALERLRHRLAESGAVAQGTS